MTDKIIKSQIGEYKELNNCYSNVIFTFIPITNRHTKFEIDLEISIKNGVDKKKKILKNEYLSSEFSKSGAAFFGIIGNYYSDKCCSYNLEICPNDIINWHFKSKDNSEFKYKIEYKIDIEKTLVHCSDERQKLIDKIEYNNNKDEIIEAKHKESTNKLLGEITNKNNKINKYIQDLHVKNAKFLNLQNENQELKNKLKMSENNGKYVESHVSDLIKKINILENEKKRIEMNWNNINCKQGEIKNVTLENEKLKKKISLLNNQGSNIDIVTRENIFLKKELEKINMKNINQLNQKDIEIGTVKESKSKLEIQNNEFEQEIGILKESKSKLEIQNNEFEQEIGTLKESKSKLEIQNNEFEQEIGNLKEYINNVFIQNTKSINKLKKTIEFYKTQNVNIKDALNSKLNIIKNYKNVENNDKIEVLMEKNKNLNDKNKEYSQSINLHNWEIESKNDTINKFKIKNQELLLNLEELNTKNINLNYKLIGMENNEEKIKDLKQNYEEKIKDLNENIDLLVIKNSKLKNELNKNYKICFEKFSNFKKQYIKLKNINEIVRNNNTKALLKNKHDKINFENLKITIELLQCKLNDSENTIATLENRIFCLEKRKELDFMKKQNNPNSNYNLVYFLK